MRMWRRIGRRGRRGANLPSGAKARISFGLVMDELKLVPFKAKAKTNAKGAKESAKGAEE
jgi:hypothetical protein